MAKFCKNCGTELKENNTCHNCGTVNGSTKTANNSSNNKINVNANNNNGNNNYNNGGYNYQPTPTNGMAIAGFVLSLLGCTGILGLIFSIIGLAQAPRYNNNGKGLAIAGICISGLSIFAYFLWFFIYAIAYEAYR